MLVASAAGDGGCAFGDSAGFCCGCGGDFSAETVVGPEAKARDGGAVCAVKGGVPVAAVESAASSAAVRGEKRAVGSAVVAGGGDNTSSATPALVVSLL